MMGEKDERRPPVERLRNGKYQGEKILGAGGFGITYRCSDMHSGRVCAVKEYMPEAIASRDPETGRIVPEPDRQRGSGRTCRKGERDEEGNSG